MFQAKQIKYQYLSNFVAYFSCALVSDDVAVVVAVAVTVSFPSTITASFIF